MRAVAFVFLVACAAEPGAIAPRDLPPTVEVDPALVSRLAARHPSPCAAIVADVPEPRAALRSAVVGVRYPAWAPMTAARCLAELYPVEEEPTLRQWAADPAMRGLRPTLERALRGQDPALVERVLGATPVVPAERPEAPVQPAQPPALEPLRR